jgi:hypothetical protein
VPQDRICFSNQLQQPSSSAFTCQLHNHNIEGLKAIQPFQWPVHRLRSTKSSKAHPRQTPPSPKPPPPHTPTLHLRTMPTTASRLSRRLAHHKPPQTRHPSYHPPHRRSTSTCSSSKRVYEANTSLSAPAAAKTPSCSHCSPPGYYPSPTCSGCGRATTARASAAANTGSST